MRTPGAGPAGTGVGSASHERVLYATLSGDGPAVAESDVVDVLLEVWAGAIYGRLPAD